MEFESESSQGPLGCGARVSEVHAASIFRAEDKRQHGPLKRWYPITTLPGATTQRTSNLHLHEVNNFKYLGCKIY